MALPHAGRPQEEHVGLGADVAAGGQRLDLVAVHPRLEGPVEILEGLARRQPRELEHGLDPALVLALELAGEDQVEKRHGRQGVARRLLDQFGQAAGRVFQAQAGQLAGQRIERREGDAPAGAFARALVTRRHRAGDGGAHRVTPSRSVRYVASGRVRVLGAGSAATWAASWARARAPKGVGARTVAVEGPS